MCVANYAANTGFAWDFIEGLYAGVAEALARREIRTCVAYPAIPERPYALAESPAEAVEQPMRLRDPRSVKQMCDRIRALGVRVLYLADRPVWHPAYARFRAAGVRHIIVHDHTSGERTVPRGVKRWLKRVRHQMPGTLADVIIAVSDFVALRKVQVDAVPAERVVRIWNSVELPATDESIGSAAAAARVALGVPDERPLVLCVCRASPEKGVDHLFRAFDKLLQDGALNTEPMLAYLGDGPELQRLHALRDSLASRDGILLAGYRDDAPRLVGGADVCVVPSVWAEAFGLAALEPMARAVPVIASRVGGIPEVVVDGETGILVPPADEAALASAIRSLLDNPQTRERMGRAGAQRAAQHFSRERQLRDLVELIGGCFTEAPDRMPHVLPADSPIS